MTAEQQEEKARIAAILATYNPVTYESTSISGGFIGKLLAGAFDIQKPNFETLIKNGFEHRNMTNEAYHAEKGHISSSRVKAVLKTEMNYVKYKSTEPTSVMAVGTIGHLVLEKYYGDNVKGSPKDFLDGFLSIDTKRKTTSDVNTLLVSQQYFDLYLNTLLDIEQKGLGDILRQAQFEVSIFGKGYGGLAQKIRIDMLIHLPNEKFDIAFDAKFLNDISKLRYVIKDYGYDLSSAMYSHLYGMATGRLLKFGFLLSNKSNNGYIQLAEISDTTMETYQELYMNAIDKINNIDFSNPKTYDNLII